MSFEANSGRELYLFMDMATGCHLRLRTQKSARKSLRKEKTSDAKGLSEAKRKKKS